MIEVGHKQDGEQNAYRVQSGRVADDQH